MVTLFFSLFFCDSLFSVTAGQYLAERKIALTQETLEKGKSIPLTPAEKSTVQSNLLQIQNYAPRRADEIREKIETSPTLRSQFADFPEGIGKKIDIKSEITKEPLTEKEIEQKLPVFAHEGTTVRTEIEKLIEEIQDIAASISGKREQSVAERMNKDTGYYHFVQLIQSWWEKIKNNPDINPAERARLREAKEKPCKIVVDFLMDDLYQEFKQFESEIIAAGEDFPYGHIVKIQNATRAKTQDFLESKEMYGNDAIEKDLNTKYATLYELLENGTIGSVLSNKHINTLIVDGSGNPRPEYKKAVQMIRLRLFGRVERLQTLNRSSLASLLWSIAYYINKVTVNVQKDRKKAMELVTLYFEKNFNLLIQYRNMFQSIIPPKSVETEITDILTILDPAIDKVTALKFANKRHQLQRETDETSDWD